MASPFTAYFAGIGTVVIALAVGFGGALILTAPSPLQKEQKSAYEKKVEASRDKPVATANPEPSKPDVSPDILVPVSPVITAANAPTVSTTFSPPVPSAPWPGSQAPSQETQRAPDPGMLQPVVRPAPPVEAAAPATAPDQPALRPREAQNAERVIEPAGEWKKKGKREQVAQKKSQRKQTVEPATVGQATEPEDEVVETRTITTYAPEPRQAAPLGIFNLLLGGN